MNSTTQHSLSPLVQYNQVISSCFLYSIYGKKSAFVRGLNKSCIMYYLVVGFFEKTDVIHKIENAVYLRISGVTPLTRL